VIRSGIHILLSVLVLIIYFRKFVNIQQLYFEKEEGEIYVICTIYSKINNSCKPNCRNGLIPKVSDALFGKAAIVRSVPFQNCYTLGIHEETLAQETSRRGQGFVG